MLARGQAAPPPPGGARRAPGGLAGAVRAPPGGRGLRAPSAIGSGRSRGPGRVLPPPLGGLCNACGGARRRRRVPAAASPRPPREAEEGSVSVVLLAGGVGKRMGAAMPKQYLPLRGKPIALHSLAVFEALPEVAEVELCTTALMFQLPTEESNQMEEQVKEANKVGLQEMARQKE